MLDGKPPIHTALSESGAAPSIGTRVFSEFNLSEFNLEFSQFSSNPERLMR
jgi:hypothetical protein